MTTRLDTPTLRSFACLLLILTSSPTTALAAKVDPRAGEVVDRAVGVAVGVFGFFKQREATAAYQAARKEAFTKGEL